MPAAIVALGGAGVAAGAWRLSAECGPGGVRQLLLHADGRAEIVTGHGREAAWVLPCSLRLGRCYLLVLRAGSRHRRLLLGPGNLAPPQLAGLARWLQSPPGGDGTAPGLLR